MQTFTFYASDDKLGNRGNTAAQIGVSYIVGNYHAWGIVVFWGLPKITAPAWGRVPFCNHFNPYPVVVRDADLLNGWVVH